MKICSRCMYIHTCEGGWDIQTVHMYSWYANINYMCLYTCCVVYVHAWIILIHYIAHLYSCTCTLLCSCVYMLVIGLCVYTDIFLAVLIFLFACSCTYVCLCAHIEHVCIRHVYAQTDVLSACIWCAYTLNSPSCSWSVLCSSHFHHHLLTISRSRVLGESI